MRDAARCCLVGGGRDGEETALTMRGVKRRVGLLCAVLSVRGIGTGSDGASGIWGRGTAREVVGDLEEEARSIGEMLMICSTRELDVARRALDGDLVL